jgi:hypothetical protein
MEAVEVYRILEMDMAGLSMVNRVSAKMMCDVSDQLGSWWPWGVDKMRLHCMFYQRRV